MKMSVVTVCTGYATMRRDIVRRAAGQATLAHTAEDVSRVSMEILHLDYYLFYQNQNTPSIIQL